VVGALVLTAIVIVALVAIIFLVRRRKQTGKLGLDSMDYTPEYATKEPLYSELKKPSPPPLPKRFPGVYATVDSMGSSGHLELVGMNDECNSISSAPPMPDPAPLKLSCQIMSSDLSSLITTH